MIMCIVICISMSAFNWNQGDVNFSGNFQSERYFENIMAN